jgi:hypothetical protein
VRCVQLDVADPVYPFSLVEVDAIEVQLAP